MNLQDVTDARIYELGIKALVETLGLPDTTRFLQICRPHESEGISGTLQKLSALEMEEIREKVY